jgi:AcrR family transcriptional regulator
VKVSRGQKDAIVFAFESGTPPFERDFHAAVNIMTLSFAPESEAVGRLQRRKARTRAAILEAADRLFHENGFEATSIAQIAEAADSGVGTLYGYFRSKDEVLYEVLRKHSDEAVRHYFATVDSNTPAIDRMCLALAGFAGFLRENRTILRAVIQNTARPPVEGSDAPMSWLVRAYAALLTEGIAAGDLADLPSDTTARALISIYLTALLGVGVWSDRAEDEGLEGELEQIARAMLVR